MKNRREISFFEQCGIIYAREPWDGSIPFYYCCKYIPTDKKIFDRVIYVDKGVDATPLIQNWNNQNPLVWKYWVNLSKNALYEKGNEG